MSYIDKLGGRKFVMSVIAEVFVFVALLASKIDGQTFLYATGLITGLYQTTNAIAKFSPEAQIWAKADTKVLESERE